MHAQQLHSDTVPSLSYILAGCYRSASASCVAFSRSHPASAWFYPCDHRTLPHTEQRTNHSAIASRNLVPAYQHPLPRAQKYHVSRQSAARGGCRGAIPSRARALTVAAPSRLYHPSHLSHGGDTGVAPTVGNLHSCTAPTVYILLRKLCSRARSKAPRRPGSPAGSRLRPASTTAAAAHASASCPEPYLQSPPPSPFWGALCRSQSAQQREQQREQQSQPQRVCHARARV
jgi:hypothetical protein